MARTRGGGSSQEGRHEGRDEERAERRRPTASARRKRAGVCIAEEASIQVPEAVAEPQAQVEAVVEPEVEAPSDDGDEFGGGPRDPSLLISYADHVAHQLWMGEDRGDLKLVSHGKKLRQFGPPCAEIAGVIGSSGLGSLIGCSLEVLDRGLVSAFVERWHKETSSFHLPVGEMTITLDDVSCLLHLPITGAFYTYEPIDTYAAVEKLVELLGVAASEARAETHHNKGPYVRLSWLREVYQSRCAALEWTQAARAYLLHLVGCTIFANKSCTHTWVVWLDLRRGVQQGQPGQGSGTT